MFQFVAQRARLEYGFDFAEAGIHSGDTAIQDGPERLCLEYLCEAWRYLIEQAHRFSSLLPIDSKVFESKVNLILEDDESRFRLREGEIVESALSELEALRRALLLDAEDMASCKQGDIQVEMVISTVQNSLATPGAVLVDYGCGLGRILSGLSTASMFQHAEYWAVDDPIDPEVRSLAGRIGANAQFQLRDEFLNSTTDASIVMIVNTLHHMPFADIPRQISALVGKLRKGACLLIHDMGRFPAPEQRNVPWPAEYICLLFKDECFSVNWRTVISRRGIPLAHVLISVAQPADYETILRANARSVWELMKARGLEEIENLYRSGEPGREAELHHALIVNANLDLNRP